MSITIVVGGQFGGEGKGKICSWLGRRADLSVSMGGPNSGHVVTDGERRMVFRMLPASAFSSAGMMAIAPGSILDVDLLLAEIAAAGVERDRVCVDHRATILEPRHREMRKVAYAAGLSTGVGTGAVIAEHVLRDERLKRAQEVPELRPMLGDVPTLIHSFHRWGRCVLVQGSQGFALSLLYGTYPFVTHRDTTAAAVCSGAGIAVRSVDAVLMVVRSYPIRSSAGPLPDEITWDEVARRAGSDRPLVEQTSFDERPRRVGVFDEHLFQYAVSINGPTALAVTFIDHLDAGSRGVIDWKKLGRVPRAFVERLEDLAGVPVRLLSTGPRDSEIIERE